MIFDMKFGTGPGEKLPPPVGTSDWAAFSRDSYCVDKTLILKDLIDSDSSVVLFTRPRRFGKTTMMKTIRSFYNAETIVDDKTFTAAELFRDKKIWAAGEKYRAEAGKRPVISNNWPYEYPEYSEYFGFTEEEIEAISSANQTNVTYVVREDGSKCAVLYDQQIGSESNDLVRFEREIREQIDGKKYDAAFRAEGITDIEKIGLAYYKGKVEMVREIKKRISGRGRKIVKHRKIVKSQNSQFAIQ